MKKERLTTPIGEAKWAHIQQPKAAFTDERGVTKGEPKYQIDVIFSPDDPQWKEWSAKVMAQVRSLPQQKDKKTDQIVPKQIPIKKELNEDNLPTGRYYCTFKTGAAFKPGVFDKFGQIIPETKLIGNGSKVRVNYTENVFDGFGGGVNFYLNAVQVVELVEYKSQTAEGYGFEVEEPAAGEGSPFGVMGKPHEQAEPGDDVPF